MRPISIITDSCADLGADLRRDLGIDYARMNFVFDGKEAYADLDWGEYPAPTFYDMMRNGTRVTTTQVPTEEFMSVFRRHLEAGCDIVYIGCSSALSGSVNTAEVVARTLREEFPEARIECVDSLRASLGEGMMVMDAAGLRDAGKTVDEIVAYLEKNRQCYNQLGTVDSLEYLHRAGRVKAAKAFFGNLFGVKPILISDVRGRNVAVRKGKGRVGAMREVVAMLTEILDGDAEGKLIGLVHGDCAEDAETLRKMIDEALPGAKFYVNYLGPIVGASCGPGTLGVYAYGKEVTVEGDE